MGVMQALLEHDIKPDIISGVSAGALAGVFYADGNEPHKVLDYFSGHKFQDLTKLVIPKKGLFDLCEFIDFLRTNVKAKNLEELQIPLIITATDLDHGRMVHFHRGSIAERVAASCCMPVMFAPVNIDGTNYVDGGLMMNLPVSTLRRVCDKVVAVNVSPIMAQDYKMNIVSIAMRSFHFMFRANTFPEREKCDLLIEPYNLYGYSNTELEKAEEIFEQGYNTANGVLNQLLVEMDGFTENEGVIVLAATNRPDVLDKALLRAGRFDRQIVVGLPDVKAREQILEVHSRRKRLSDDVDLKVIAKNTSGFAGADLENVLNEAALLAARRNLNEIGMKEIEDAMVKVTMGPEKKTKVRSEKENRLVAYHEAGHAVVSHYLETQDPVHQISIVPRGMAGGYTMYRPTEDKSFMSKTEMEENIVSLLGGRVAEALILNDISTGASNDIERATGIARSMVTKYGMSDRIGALMLGSNQEQVFLGRDIAQGREYSEETAAIIDEETKRIVDTGYNRAKQILSDNIDKLHQVAGILLEKEKIEADEFEAIFGKE